MTANLSIEPGTETSRRYGQELHLQERSGRVTFVRTKLVPATPAMLGREAEAPARRAARAEDVRRIEAIVMMRHCLDDERYICYHPSVLKFGPGEERSIAVGM